jgi:hypothetical protein
MYILCLLISVDSIKELEKMSEKYVRCGSVSTDDEASKRRRNITERFINAAVSGISPAKRKKHVSKQLFGDKSSPDADDVDADDPLRQSTSNWSVEGFMPLKRSADGITRAKVSKQLPTPPLFGTPHSPDADETLGNGQTIRQSTPNCNAASLTSSVSRRLQTADHHCEAHCQCAKMEGNC